VAVPCASKRAPPRWGTFRAALLTSKPGLPFFKPLSVALNEILHNYERLENSQRIAGLGDWVQDFSTRQLTWSDGIYRILGLSRADGPPTSEAFYQRVHPDDLAFVNRQKKTAVEGMRRVEFSHRIVRSDGQVRHVHQIIETTYDDQGRALRESGTLQDVTALKLAEEALRQSEASLAAAQRLAQVGSWELDLVDPLDLSRCPTRWSDELFRLLGFEPGQFTATTARAMEVVHTGDRTIVARAMTDLIHQAKSFDICYRIIRGDGSLRVVQERAAVLATVQPPRIVGTVQDITERARAEEARRQSEDRFTRIFRSSPIAIAYAGTDHDSSFIDVNDRWAEFFGYSREEMIGYTVEDLGLWVDTEQRRILLARLTTEGVVTNFEASFRTKSGAIRVALISVELLQFSAQRARLSMLVDITERKQSEEALRMQSQVLESMVEGVTVVDSDDLILFSNAACDAMFGYPRGTLVGRNVTTLIELPEDEGRALAARLREHVQRTGSWSGETANRKRDGTPFVTRAQMAPVEIAGKKCIVVVREDITQTKQLESQLLRVQRVESVSRLASGIAHDMNNILAPITMAVSLLRTSAHGTKQMEKLLALIETNATRGASLVKQLLFFGRGIEGQRTVLRLKDSIREIEDMISETFPRSIEIESRVAEDACPLRADATQIHQVLLNLCVNARDAMPQGGTLSLSVANVAVTEGFPGRPPDATPGPYVVLTVADTGTGIPPEHREKIFDPFYTTKEVGKGTGLGLSTVIAIVKGHGGFVTMKSEMGQGTAFQIYLPALEIPAAATPAGVAATPPKGQNETVLLVDDEESIREITCEILTRSGYRVLTAVDGAQGAVLFAQHAEEIKLVLTDYDMPVMDGLALIRVLKQIDPEVKVIIATGVQSGFRSEVRIAELKALGVTTTLAKPFSTQSLLSAIHALIGPVAKNPPS
jgi:PAS domain S-box-containing protein